MTRIEAIRLALDILRPFAESGLYDDYKTEEAFSDEQYDTMLAILHADDPKSKQGPWSVLYEADASVYQIGPFDNRADALQAATKAQAEGEYDARDQQVYLIGPDHHLWLVSDEDVIGDGDEYDAELAADQILERQELEDFEGMDPFEGSQDA